MHKLCQRAFQMSHRDAAIDAESFDLEEHRIVSWIGRVAAEHAARRDHPHGRAASLHRMNLHRRSLRAQRKTIRGIERVLRIARRMTFRNIQRVEVIEVGFDLAIIFDGVTERDENIFDALAHQRDRMQVTRTRTTTGHGHINRFTRNACAQDKGPQPEISIIYSMGNILLELLTRKSKITALTGIINASDKLLSSC